RDIPILAAQKRDGAATVAATMIIANLAGISVFATGGVGGVHRGGETTMDISADLEELARTPVMVVCAGAKSILDLGLTLEYLETKGVAVVGYRTEELPAFYTRTSGFKLNSSLNSPKEIAQSFFIQNGLDYRMGMLVVNPIPEQYDMDGKYIENAIEYALKKAQKAGIRGKETTPFLLNEIKEITGGKSLEANIHLVYNNAELAARIACEYAALKKPNA
ncbi:pseudouridine-5'-phosphate glycosidase, partial [Treponema lecithinolyticum]